MGTLMMIIAWALTALAQAEDWYWLLTVSGAMFLILGIITFIRKKYSLGRSDISGIGARIIGAILIAIGVVIEILYLKTK